MCSIGLFVSTFSISISFINNLLYNRIPKITTESSSLSVHSFSMEKIFELILISKNCICFICFESFILFNEICHQLRKIVSEPKEKEKIFLKPLTPFPSHINQFANFFLISSRGGNFFSLFFCLKNRFLLCNQTIFFYIWPWM